MAATTGNLFDTPERTTYFIDVILPVPVPKLFTYRVPFELNKFITPGQRVVVPFGQRNVLTGVIKRISQTPPTGYEARPMLDILEETPAFNSTMLKFLDWLAAYYMANPGDVLQVALPAGLKVSSESLVQLNPHYTTTNTLAMDEQLLIEYLQEHEYIGYNEIPKLLGKKSISKVIKSLLNRQAILLFDKIKERFSPKKVTYVRLAPALVQQESKLQETFEQLAKKTKQQDVLVTYLKCVPALENPSLNEKGIKKATLLAQGCSKSSIETLARNNVLELVERIESRFYEQETEPTPLLLSTPQQEAIQEILIGFEAKPVVYLHGITGSGKTEIYTELIQQVVAQGEQALFLVPEIALTTQLVMRLKKVLGSKLGVYHSRYSDNERVEVWQGVQQGKYNVVIGVRSSIFLPFDNLGIIIIDEEHEPGYKQIDPSPRYHARDAALMLGHLHHAKVLLGSATPAVESYYNALQGKYKLVNLHKRFGDAVMPAIEVANIAREQKKKTMKGLLSSQLFEAINQTLASNKQIIIFQNRRGYAPFVSCTLCGWTPHCHHCDVSLTYHLFSHELKCHYCGQTAPLPTQCKECHATEIKAINYGTEQLEESLQVVFPNHRVARMDQDTTRGKHSFEKLIEDFSNHQIDILVGTQMVAKGLDFNNVHLVGIFDFDRMLHFPDFRSVERTFSLVTQVAGRAGRRSNQGRVIIQTYNPGHEVLPFILSHNYSGFYQSELKERQSFAYPPFVRLIKLTLKYKEAEKCAEACSWLTSLLSSHVEARNLPVKVYGPIQPVISKIRNKYIYEVLLKIDRNASGLNKIKILIWKTVQQVLISGQYKGIRIAFNVDPM